MLRSRLRLAGSAAVLATASLAAVASAEPQSGTVQSTITVPIPETNRAAQPSTSAGADQPLQLEVTVNGVTTNLIASFTLHADKTLSSPASELKAVGLKVPDTATDTVNIPLDALPGLTYQYDETTQTIAFTAQASAQIPVVIEGRGVTPVAHPERPPFGATLNYTLFAGGGNNTGAFRLQSAAGEFEALLFGEYGLVENGFIARAVGAPTLVRLDSTYSYEDPDGLWIARAGDFISGGFNWTRPIRMVGLQFQRDFGIRPDLITMPLPDLGGTAAAPSTLDLYINNVRAASTPVPQGPYQILNPPVTEGVGQARIVLTDALGVETVSSSPFYASPDLLQPGLSDYSFEIGFARRQYGTVSNDYFGEPAFSGSYREGVEPWLTLGAHAEGTTKFGSLGGGGAFTIGDIGVGSIALAGSFAGRKTGGLLDLGFESRSTPFSILLHTTRTTGEYEDLASQTAETGPGINSRIFEVPKAMDQAAISFQPPWPGATAAFTYVNETQADGERSQIVGVGFTQDIGKFSFFASANRDLSQKGSTFVFVGLTTLLGDDVTATVGGTFSQGDTAYAEFSEPTTDEPGDFGWTARGSSDQGGTMLAIGRYNADFARLDAAALYTNGAESGTLAVEGALTAIPDEGVFATRRLNDSFAVVDVGQPDVTVLRENRVAGQTASDGTLLVPDLVPFTENHFAIDPSALPVDAQVSRTEAVATPFSKVPVVVDLKALSNTRSALVVLHDAKDEPVPVGSEVQLNGGEARTIVGYDGAAFLDDLSDDNNIVVTLTSGATCRATFPFKPSPGAQVRIGPIACREEN